MHLLLLEAEGDHTHKEIQKDSPYSGLNGNTRRRQNEHRRTYKELKPAVCVESQTDAHRGAGEQHGYRASAVPRPLCFISEDCLE